MISFDTNLLLYSLNQDCSQYGDARGFFATLPATPGAVAICELILVELYVLLRNPAVLKNPLDAAKGTMRWTLASLAANARQALMSSRSRSG